MCVAFFANVMEALYSAKLHHSIVDVDEYEKHVSLENLQKYISETLGHMTVAEFINEPCGSEELLPLSEILYDVLYSNLHLFHDYQFSVAAKRLWSLRSVILRSSY